MSAVHGTYYEVKEVNTADSYARVVRTPHAFPTLEVMLDAHRDLARLFAEWRVDGLLLDVRQARGRNDSAFESALRQFRVDCAERFERVAILLASIIGVMHAQRLNSGRGFEHVHAFKDEAEALAYLRG